MPMSKFLEEALLKHAVGNTTYTKPTKCFLALCQAEVHAGETGTEIESQTAGKAKECSNSEAKYTGYARIELPVAEWEFSGENPVKALNKALVKFAACTGGSAKVKWVAVCDAVTGGNVLFYAEVTEFEVSASQTPAEAAAKAIEATLK